MSMFDSPRFLTRVMALDAASCAATGELQIAFTAPFARLTGLPAAMLVGTGVFLLVYAAAAAWIASRTTSSRNLIGAAVVGNFGWAALCVLLIASGAFALTALGVGWALLQAVVVVLLAELQWMGLRRTRRTARAVPA